MDLITQSIVVAVLLVAGVLAGAWWGRSTAPSPQAQRGGHLPADFVVTPRPTLRPAEREVWQWLRQVFPEHQVMVKLPVTRFTMPRDMAAANDWFQLLNGIYCTFTVCDDLGRVMGCVDVMGERRLSSGNQQLKQNLLTQCKIGYWAMAVDSVPEPDAIRVRFLGAAATPVSTGNTDFTELQAARDNLVELLDRNRNYRRSHMMPLEEDMPPRSMSAWAQPDSLSMSLNGALDAAEQR